MGQQVAKARRVSSRGSSTVSTGFCSTKSGERTRGTVRASSASSSSSGDLEVDAIRVDTNPIQSERNDSQIQRGHEVGQVSAVASPNWYREQPPTTPRNSARGGFSPDTGMTSDGTTTYVSRTPESSSVEVGSPSGSWQVASPSCSSTSSPSRPALREYFEHHPPQSLTVRGVASERSITEAPLWEASPTSAAAMARFDALGSEDTASRLRTNRALGASTPHAASGGSPRGTTGQTRQPSHVSRPGSWLANRLEQESTANDAAIARALAEQLAEEDRREAAAMHANRERAAAAAMPRRRASDPGSLIRYSTGGYYAPHHGHGFHRVENDRAERSDSRTERPALSVLAARDEALAIAIALTEEESGAISPTLRRLRHPGLALPGHPGHPHGHTMHFAAPHFDDSKPSPREVDEKNGENCIACEDAVVNCCLIPCGHVILCIACARRVNPPRCPVCRMPFQQVVRTNKRTRNI